MHIQLAEKAAKNDTATFTIHYSGIPQDGLIISKNKYGARTFFGDNWPNRARHWLPVVDHPSDKASCEFLVEAPHHYQVVANGIEKERSFVDAQTQLSHWKSAVPIPTKVMVIGAARFAVQHVENHRDIAVSSWVYPEERENGFYDYALAASILDYFEEQVGPYPYEKLANVQSKTRYGGMENASNIFYHEHSITGTRSVEGLLAHEIAHQWFGNSVSELDWPHIWLSEGFATYFTELYMEATYGREKMNERMERARQKVLAHYKNAPKATVIDTTFTDLNSLLNAYSYQKGAWVLHMLRFVVGDAAFWKGIRAYYKNFRDGNAQSSDLQKIMEEASGMDLNGFFNQWLRQPELPRYTMEWSYKKSKKQLKLSIRQDKAAFSMPVEVGVYKEGTLIKMIKLPVEGKKQSFESSLETAPDEVVLDPNKWLLKE